MVLAILLLFPAMSALVMGLFLDDIAQAVEQKHYVTDVPGKPVGLKESLISALKLAGEMLLLNLLALPFYLIFLFFPLLSVALYYGINGHLLNREYFELVAQRHGDAAHHKMMRKKHGGRLFLGGCVIAFLFTVPFINLAAPLLGTGLMVHLYKQFPEAMGIQRA